MTLFNLVFVRAMAMLALDISVEIATVFINFVAFLAFATVNLCLIAYLIRSRQHGKELSMTGFIVLPILGAAVDIYLAKREAAGPESFVAWDLGKVEVPPVW